MGNKLRYYSPNAIAIDPRGKATRLFTYGDVQDKQSCFTTFETWEKHYGYKLICTWIDVRDEKKKRLRRIAFKEYRNNLF